MLQKIVARRAAQLRELLDRGAFVGLRVPLRNGGTLPADMLAKVALDDVDHLSRFRPNGDSQDAGISWQRIAEDIERLHEVALARDTASVERN